MEKYGIIYCVYNKANGKRYIGQTIKSLAVRRRLHYSKHSFCKFFHSALMKYPESVWEWKIIDIGYNFEDLNNKECFWIEFFHTCNPEFGYNLTSGGQGSKDVLFTEEHKRKTREGMIKTKGVEYSSNLQNFNKPIKNHQTGQCYFSISEAMKLTGDKNIYWKINRGTNEWEILEGAEKIKYCPNAIYCVELDKVYENMRHARLEDNFHPGNLSKAMKKGSPDENKHYGGYTFRWVNPEYHCGTAL